MAREGKMSFFPVPRVGSAWAPLTRVLEADAGVSAKSYQHGFPHPHPQASGTRDTHGLGYPESELRREHPNTCGTEGWEEGVWAPRSSDCHLAVQVGARTRERPCQPRTGHGMPSRPSVGDLVCPKAD